MRIEENREHTIILSEELRLSIHPRPITDEDAEELGSLIPEQFEDGFECSHSHHHIDDQTLSMGNISSHKATIPIAKMRELIDIDDCEPYTGYRCPVCAKCNQCKTSVRTTAISLQEAAEQHLIEESVKLVREKKRVVVTLPFTQDPVKFLTNRHGGLEIISKRSHSNGSSGTRSINPYRRPQRRWKMGNAMEARVESSSSMRHGQH